MTVRASASAVALIVAVLTAATAPMFAAAGHPACTAKHHDCGKAPVFRGCCCDDGQSTPSDSTPAHARADVTPIVSATAAVTGAVQVALTPHMRVPVHTSPPHQFLVDLPTLHSSLLI
jgi:hypothetical protein